LIRLTYRSAWKGDRTLVQGGILMQQGDENCSKVLKVQFADCEFVPRWDSGESTPPF
jgi:hypothetical protein